MSKELKRQMRCIETHQKSVFVNVDEDGVISFEKRKIKFEPLEKEVTEAYSYQTWRVKDWNSSAYVAMVYEINGRYFASYNEANMEGIDHMDAIVRLLVEDWEFGGVFL